MSAPSVYWLALERFREFAQADPDRDAVIYPVGRNGDRPRYSTLSYRELDEWSQVVAARLPGTGVRAGTRTIVLVPPGPELYAVLFGLLRIGAVPVVIDPGMGLRKMLRCLRAVDAEAFVGIPRAHAMRVLFPRCFGRVRANLTVGRRWFWGGYSLRDWGTRTSQVAPEVVPATEDEVLIIAFTTGSTGPAKAVELTHGNVAAMLEQVHAARGHEAPGTSLITLALVGLLDLLLGSRCVLPPLEPSRVGSTDPEHVVDAINRFGVRSLFASPALLTPLLAHLQRHGTVLPTLRSVISGGAPVPPRVVDGLRRALPESARVYAGYGSTEALPISIIESRELFDGPVRRAAAGDGTCLGAPVPGTAAKIVAITDQPLATLAEAEELPAGPRRRVGEILVSGRQVSIRYRWPDSANAVGKIRDGDVIWHRTGDLGWIDERGRIWFCGRKSQRVRTTAGPMFTVQIEQMFNTVSGVARTALVGVGAPEAQRPVLCVELDRTADPGVVAARLRAHAAESELTARVTTFLFHPGFPVDIRHNAKIGRERLAGWAERRAGRETRRGEDAQ